jgi:tetratricopeptide (TPR) repeat protein
LVAVVFAVVFVVVIPYVFYPDQTLYYDAQKLVADGNYGAALEKYQVLRDSYPNSYYTLLAFNDTLDCNYAYISSLVADKKYDEALQQYALLLNETSVTWTSPEKDSVLKDIPANVLFDWGTKLKEQNATIALRVYDVIVKYHADSNYTSEADNTIVNMELAIISQGNYSPLSSPYSTSSQQLGGKAQLIVINDSPDPLTVYLKGSVTKRVIIEGSPNSTIIFSPHEIPLIPLGGGNNATITLEPGTYEMAFKTSGGNGLYGEKYLASDTSYEYWTYVSAFK